MKKEINPETIEINQISDLGTKLGYEVSPSSDPRIGVIECPKPLELPLKTVKVSHYSLFINKGSQRIVPYGNGYYRYDCNSLSFKKPGQEIEIVPFERDGVKVPPVTEGIGINVQPDYLVGTQLLKRIGKYNFFLYHDSEAIVVSPDALELLEYEINAIKEELNKPTDAMTREIVISRLTTIYNICERISSRNAANDSVENAHNAANIMNRFEVEVMDYFENKAPTEGFPTVKYLAKKFDLSYPYFSDLIRRSSGIPVMTHLHNVAIQIAKDKLLATDESVAEISKSLGFQYPNHFSRLFRRYEGMTPSEFRLKAAQKH